MGLNNDQILSTVGGEQLPVKQKSLW